MEIDLVMIITPNCPKCNELKKTLDSKGINYFCINPSAGEGELQYVRNLKGITAEAPQLFRNGKRIEVEDV